MTAPNRLTLPMPRLGETMDEGTITEWLVQPGQSFSRGDPLLEVETDKTVVEYPALGNGTLIETLVGHGDVVAVGTPIAVIETQDTWDGIAATAAGDNTQAPATAGPAPIDPPARPDTGARLRATPLARRIAGQKGLTLDQVTGTGRRGRIEADDVRAAIAAATGARTSPPAEAGMLYLVHGFAGMGSTWAALRAHLQRSAIKAVAPDLPGHGANPTDVATVAALVDWLLQDLADLPEPVHLVGHSLGAHVAAHAALRNPAKVARLTLITPAGCGLALNGTFTQGMAAGPTVGELAHLMRLLGPAAAALDNDALTSMADRLQAGRLRALADDMARGDVQKIDTIAALNALRGVVPISAVFGLHDRIIPRDNVFNVPAHVACHIVDTGHMPHWDAVDTVAQIITAR